MTRTVLQPGTRGGPPVRDTRGWRIVAEQDASVVVHDPDGTSRVLARPGEVHRVVLVRGADLRRRLGGRGHSADVVAFLADGAVLLSVPVKVLHLGSIETADPDLMRATSGVADFAQAIGCTLELASPEEVAAVNRATDAFTRGPTQDSLRRHRLLQCVLLLVIALAYAAALAAGDARPQSDLAMAVVAIACVAFVADTWRFNQQFLAQEAPAPGGRIVVPNVVPPGHWRWLRESQLQIGADEVVHTDHVRETWLPGPRRGGVVTCAISPDAIWFLDRHGVALSVASAERWVPPGGADALELACLGAGIQVRTRRDPDAPALLTADLDPSVYESHPQALASLIPGQERGVLVPAAALVVGVASLGLAGANLVLLVPQGFDAVRLLLGLVGVGCLAALARLELRHRAWNKRQMSTTDREEARR